MELVEREPVFNKESVDLRERSAAVVLGSKLALAIDRLCAREQARCAAKNLEVISLRINFQQVHLADRVLDRPVVEPDHRDLNDLSRRVPIAVITLTQVAGGENGGAPVIPGDVKLDSTLARPARKWVHPCSGLVLCDALEHPVGVWGGFEGVHRGARKLMQHTVDRLSLVGADVDDGDACVRPLRKASRLRLNLHPSFRAQFWAARREEDRQHALAHQSGLGL